MKRWNHTKSGSAVGSGIRQGRVKFGTGKQFTLGNGISINPASSQVNIDSVTGEIYVYLNLFIEAIDPQDNRNNVWAEYTALTPEEATDIFNYYSDMTFEQAFNELYDTSPDYFSRYNGHKL